jgi:hypothetical protein
LEFQKLELKLEIGIPKIGYGIEIGIPKIGSEIGI